MSDYHDITGKRSGTLIAEEYLGNSKWRCKCVKCGNTVIVSSYWFNKNQKLERDGCKHSSHINSGDVFGLLTVIEQSEDYIKPKTGAHERQWKCKCVCGRDKIILESNLKARKSLTCGLCSNRISIPEKMIYYYLSFIFSDIKENYHPPFLDGKEIDVFIPSLNLGIEYDGERWHEDLAKDIEKDNKCTANGIHIIHIREPKCPKSSQFEYQIITPKPTTNGTHMTEPIKAILNILTTDYSIICNIDVNCLRDNADICKRIITTSGFNSLSAAFPDIAAEWDYKKNSPLTPDNVPAHSGKKAWWICKNGHSYNSVIASRTGKGKTGCPFCSGVGASAYRNGKYLGENSLAKVRPDIASEFYEEKNGISANDIAVSSNKKMWFKCANCGYVWLTKVNNRTSLNNQGCPNCAKERRHLYKSKPVRCIENSKNYKSITEASKQTGIKKNEILSCCTGSKDTAGGFHWTYNT